MLHSLFCVKISDRLPHIFFSFQRKISLEKVFFSSMVFLLFGSFSIILFDISSFYNGLIIANVPKAMFSCFDPTTKCFEYMRLKLEGGYTIYNNMRAYGRDGNGQHFVRALVRNRKVQKPLELSKLLFITFPFSKQIERSRTTIICPFASDATASMCVCARIIFTDIVYSSVCQGNYRTHTFQRTV